jgi:transcriptional regulator with XRE-family HTH domain
VGICGASVSGFGGGGMTGEEIRAARQRLGLTQEQLAGKMGLHGKQTVSQWERGVRTPKGPSLLLLRSLLDAQLLSGGGGSSDAPPPPRR